MVSQKKARIGVLALQGAFQLHRRHLEAIGAEYVEITQGDQLSGIDGLILPGGESGVMLKLIDAAGLSKTLSSYLASKPAWGICAGAILMAKTVRNPEQRSFGVIDIEIERNAYGRQRESSEELVDGFPVSYIRAPRISSVGPRVKVLSQRGEDPVWVEGGQAMVTTFHPETTLVAPSPWHERFIERCMGAT